MWSLAVDLVLVVFIGLGAWRGYREGIFVSSANLIGLIVSLLLALWWYEPLADWLLTIWSIPAGLMNIFAFLLLAFVIDAAISAVIIMGSNRLSVHWLQAPLTRWLGVAPGLTSAVITASYMAALVTGLPLEHPIKTSVTGSTVARPLISFTQYVGLPVDKLVTPAIKDISQLFTIQPDSKEMVELGFKVQNPTLSPEDEEEMLRLVNIERAKADVGPVTMDKSLRDLARAHSLDMFRRGYFSHYTPEGKDPFDRMQAYNIRYMAAGENLALAPTVDMAHTGLMNSPGHKRNILDPKYNKLGIGAYKHPRYGIMFSQEFTN